MIKQIIENAFRSWQECGGMLFNSQNDKLSLASKQSLLSLVKSEINHYQEFLILLKIASKEMYQLANKENLETLMHFNRLNKMRNENRRVSKRIKQLARIAKELKMSM